MYYVALNLLPANQEAGHETCRPIGLKEDLIGLSSRRHTAHGGEEGREKTHSGEPGSKQAARKEATTILLTRWPKCGALNDSPTEGCAVRNTTYRGGWIVCQFSPSPNKTLAATAW